MNKFLAGLAAFLSATQVVAQAAPARQAGQNHATQTQTGVATGKAHAPVFDAKSGRSQQADLWTALQLCSSTQPSNPGSTSSGIAWALRRRARFSRRTVPESLSSITTMTAGSMFIFLLTKYFKPCADLSVFEIQSAKCLLLYSSSRTSYNSCSRCSFVSNSAMECSPLGKNCHNSPAMGSSLRGRPGTTNHVTLILSRLVPDSPDNRGCPITRIPMIESAVHIHLPCSAETRAASPRRASNCSGGPAGTASRC